MTTPSFNVDPEQLRGHANRLAGHADELAAIGARLPGALGEQSLGSFAQFLTAGLGGAMAATLDAFAHAASTVDKVGSGVRLTADEYQRADDDNASTFTGISTDPGEGAR